MIKVFITGASGNVGSTIVRHIQSRSEFQLVGGWAKEAGQDMGTLAGLAPLGLSVSPSLEQGLDASQPDVVIDFSATPLLRGNLQAYADRGLNAVVGTTGLTESDLAPFAQLVRDKGLRWAVIPNYGLGISLASQFIQQARQFYPYITISDQHTQAMANAPSGTAAALAADAVNAANALPLGAVESQEVYPGVLGASISGVPVFSQRLPFPGPYSGHVITLARPDEVIKLEVMDFTSDIYMDGVFLTAGKIAGFPAGTLLRSLAQVING